MYTLNLGHSSNVFNVTNVQINQCLHNSIEASGTGLLVQVIMGSLHLQFVMFLQEHLGARCYLIDVICL